MDRQSFKACSKKSGNKGHQKKKVCGVENQFVMAEFSHSVMKLVVAEICNSNGFGYVTESANEALTEVYEKCIESTIERAPLSNQLTKQCIIFVFETFHRSSKHCPPESRNCESGWQNRIQLFGRKACSNKVF